MPGINTILGATVIQEGAVDALATSAATTEASLSNLANTQNKLGDSARSTAGMENMLMKSMEGVHAITTSITLEISQLANKYILVGANIDKSMRVIKEYNTALVQQRMVTGVAGQSIDAYAKQIDALSKKYQDTRIDIMRFQASLESSYLFFGKTDSIEKNSRVLREWWGSFDKGEQAMGSFKGTMERYPDLLDRITKGTISESEARKELVHVHGLSFEQAQKTAAFGARYGRRMTGAETGEDKEESKLNAVAEAKERRDKWLEEQRALRGPMGTFARGRLEAGYDKMVATGGSTVSQGYLAQTEVAGGIGQVAASAGTLFALNLLLKNFNKIGDISGGMPGWIKKLFYTGGGVVGRKVLGGRGGLKDAVGGIGSVMGGLPLETTQNAVRVWVVGHGVSNVIPLGEEAESRKAKRISQRVDTNIGRWGAYGPKAMSTPYSKLGSISRVGQLAETGAGFMPTAMALFAPLAIAFGIGLIGKTIIDKISDKKFAKAQESGLDVDKSITDYRSKLKSTTSALDDQAAAESRLRERIGEINDELKAGLLGRESELDYLKQYVGMVPQAVAATNDMAVEYKKKVEKTRREYLETSASDIGTKNLAKDAFNKALSEEASFLKARRDMVIDEQKALLEAEGTRINAQERLVTAFNLGPAAMMNVQLKKVSLATQEYNNTLLNYELAVKEGKTSRADLARMEAAVEDAQAKKLEASNYARRTFLEQFVAGITNAGGAMKKGLIGGGDIAPGKVLGPSYYEGAYIGNQGGRLRMGETWQTQANMMGDRRSDAEKIVNSVTKGNDIATTSDNTLSDIYRQINVISGTLGTVMGGSGGMTGTGGVLPVMGSNAGTGGIDYGGGGVGVGFKPGDRFIGMEEQNRIDTESRTKHRQTAMTGQDKWAKDTTRFEKGWTGGVKDTKHPYLDYIFGGQGEKESSTVTLDPKALKGVTLMVQSSDGSFAKLITTEVKQAIVSNRM